MKKIIYILVGLSVAFVIFRPICVVIPAEDIKDLSPSLEERQTERGMIYKIFKQKEGNWYQCKSAVERFFFS